MERIQPIADMDAYEFQTGVGPCPDDLNGDRRVDLPDLAIRLAAYGVGDGGDLNCDGVTNLSDVAILLANHGMTCD